MKNTWERNFWRKKFDFLEKTLRLLGNFAGIEKRLRRLRGVEKLMLKEDLVSLLKNFSNAKLNILSYIILLGPLFFLYCFHFTYSFYPIIWFFLALKKLINPSGFYKTLSQKYNCIKTYIYTMKSIYESIKNNDVLWNLYKNKLQFCDNIFHNRVGFTKDQNEMLDLLDSIPIGWSY